MGMEMIVVNGRRRVVLDLQDYQDLLDARDAAASLRDIAAGAPTFAGKDLDEYLAAPTPLAFGRKRSGRTQVALAREAGISQPFLAELESGAKSPSLDVLVKLARALGVRIDDLVA
jgi:DNA-binding XRE family transcriptional regulator